MLALLILSIAVAAYLAMKKAGGGGGLPSRPEVPRKSTTHGFTVVQNPYESKWEHIPVKVGKIVSGVLLMSCD